MATIADTHTKLAADLGDASHATWSAADLERCITHALEDMAARGIGDQAYTDHAGDGTAKIKISDHAKIQQVLAVEYPIGDDPPTYINFHITSDGTDTWVWLHTDDLPAASESVRFYHLSTLADVPIRLEATILAGARMYCYEIQTNKLANTLGVDAWVANRYRDLHDRARLAWDSRLDALPQWTPPRFSRPNRANWRDLA